MSDFGKFWQNDAFDAEAEDDLIQDLVCAQTRRPKQGIRKEIPTGRGQTSSKRSNKNFNALEFRKQKQQQQQQTQERLKNEREQERLRKLELWGEEDKKGKKKSGSQKKRDHVMKTISNMTIKNVSCDIKLRDNMDVVYDKRVLYNADSFTEDKEKLVVAKHIERDVSDDGLQFVIKEHPLAVSKPDIHNLMIHGRTVLKHVIDVEAKPVQLRSGKAINKLRVNLSKRNFAFGLDGKPIPSTKIEETMKTNVDIDLPQENSVKNLTVSDFLKQETEWVVVKEETKRQKRALKKANNNKIMECKNDIENSTTIPVQEDVIEMLQVADKVEATVVTKNDKEVEKPAKMEATIQTQKVKMDVKTEIETKPELSVETSNGSQSKDAYTLHLESKLENLMKKMDTIMESLSKIMEENNQLRMTIDKMNMEKAGAERIAAFKARRANLESSVKQPKIVEQEKPKEFVQTNPNLGSSVKQEKVAEQKKPKEDVPIKSTGTIPKIKEEVLTEPLIEKFQDDGNNLKVNMNLASTSKDQKEVIANLLTEEKEVIEKAVNQEVRKVNSKPVVEEFAETLKKNLVRSNTNIKFSPTQRAQVRKDPNKPKGVFWDDWEKIKKKPKEQQDAAVRKAYNRAFYGLSTSLKRRWDLCNPKIENPWLVKSGFIWNKLATKSLNDIWDCIQEWKAQACAFSPEGVKKMWYKL
jgi:hypothetical protein